MTDQYADTGNNFNPLAVMEEAGSVIPASWYAGEVLRSGQWNTLPESVQSALNVEATIIFGGIGVITEQVSTEAE